MKDIDSNLTLSHYKEPLQKVKGGFGYYGCLLGTKDGSRIQCHECGKLWKDLAKHANHTHDLDAKEYRAKYMLSGSTALVSENQRNRRKQTFLDWLKTISEEEQKAYWKNATEKANKAWKFRKNHPKESLEAKNKKGTCPDQLLDKIKQVAKKLGKTPSKAEFIFETGTQRFVHLIYKTFGSWTTAISMLKLDPKQRKMGRFKVYSDEELLEYLRIFTRQNMKIPTYTDFNRGLLPSYQVYSRRFGDIETARQQANVYQYVDSSESPFFGRSK